jgi:hypothetical protein
MDAYDVTVRKKGNLFVVFIPELNLAESDENLEQAYHRLEQAKVHHLTRMRELGLADIMQTSPRTVPVQESLADRIFPGVALFLIKFTIIFILLGIGAGVFMHRAATLPHKAATWGRTTIAQFNETMNNMPAENKEEFKLKIRRTMQSLQPFMKELLTLFHQPTEEPSEKSVEQTTPDK